MLIESPVLHGTRQSGTKQMQLNLVWVAEGSGLDPQSLEHLQTQVSSAFEISFRKLLRQRSVCKGFDAAEGAGEIQVARRIYVGNLPYSVAWQDLKDHFKPVGEGIPGCCYSGCWSKSG